MDEPAAPNAATALARVVVDELVRAGVREAVLAPGSRSAALASALAERDDVAVHVLLDERSAGFCALGLARATGRVAPVVVTSGTAVANLHPAAVEADLAAVPWLALTADRPPELRDAGANQTIRQPGLLGRAVRWEADLQAAEDRPGAPAHWRSLASRAVAEAYGLAGPPGPVQLNLGFREPTVPVGDDGRTSVPAYATALDGRADGRPWTAVTAAVPGAGEVDRLAAEAAARPRGLIVAGDADVDAEAALALGRAAGWPVVAEATSPVRAHPEALTAGGWLAGAPGFAAAHRPDLVVRLGSANLSRPLAALTAAVPHQVVVDAHGRWLDPDRTASDLVVADPSAWCRALAERLDSAAADAGWVEAWRAAEAAARAALEAALDDGGLHEPAAARAAARGAPDGAALVVASSMPVRDLDATLPAGHRLRVHANRGASGIDGFVATALGVALGSGAPTVALAGDLSLLHDRNGLLLDAEGGAPDCVLVVVDNDGGGIFHLLPPAEHAAGFERLFATPHGVDLAAVAAGHGLPHRRVADAEELAAAVAEGCAAGGVRLVEARTDRAAQPDERARLRAAVAAAVDR